MSDGYSVEALLFLSVMINPLSVKLRPLNESHGNLESKNHFFYDIQHCHQISWFNLLAKRNELAFRHSENAYFY